MFMNLLPTGRRKVAAVTLFAGVALMSWWLVTGNRTGNQIEWLAASPVRKPRLVFLRKWIWPLEKEMLRLKQWMFGVPPGITIDATIVEFNPAAVLDLTPQVHGFTNSTGARAFVMETNETPGDAFLRTAAIPTSVNKPLWSPKMRLADGMQGQMQMSEVAWVGSSTNFQKAWAGWFMDVCPRVSDRSVELECFLTHTERALQTGARLDEDGTRTYFLRTNVSLGARARIPENGRLLLISPAINSNGHVIGVLLSPTVQRPPAR